jgi:hypothetical protein
LPQAAHTAAHLGTEEAFLAERPVAFVVGAPQCLGVRLRADGDTRGSVVKDIAVARVTWAGIGAIDHCAAGKMTVGIAVGCQDNGHLTLERG